MSGEDEEIWNAFNRRMNKTTQTIHDNEAAKIQHLFEISYQ